MFAWIPVNYFGSAAGVELGLRSGILLDTWHWPVLCALCCISLIDLIRLVFIFSESLSHQSHSDDSVGMLSSEKFHHFLWVLADPVFCSVTSWIMPSNAIIVPVIQHCQTSLHSDSRPLDEILCIVRLSHLMTHELWEVASVWPGVVSPPRSCDIGGRDPGAWAWPEPTIDILGLKMRSITAMEVAESATGPNPLRLIFLNNVLHHLVLLRGLYGHQVHAHAPADVPGVQPPNLESSKFWFSREEIIMSSSLVHVVLGSVLASFQCWRSNQPSRGSHSC